MSNIKCRVKINRILFPRGKINTGDFAILSCEVMQTLEGEAKTNKYNCIIVKGNVPEINLTDTYTVVGEEVEDPKYGLQYNLIYIGSPIELNSTEKQKIFLQRILTENQYDNLYKNIENPFDIIKNENIEALSKVKGIGIKTAYKIIDKYKESIDYSDIYVELYNFGLSNNMIDKLIDKYKSPQIVVSKIKENPYILADEIDGIGWQKADSMALKAGYEQFSSFRVKAFINSYLKTEALEGNSYVKPLDLMQQILNNIGDIDRTKLKNITHNMSELWWNKEKTKVGLKYYYKLEENIGRELLRLLHGENNFQYKDWKEIIKQTEEHQGWQYTDQQLLGIQTVLENNVVFITGYSGTGKSSIVSGMLNVLQKYSFAQTALSGRAASRLKEITNEDGYTIHKLLGYKPPLGFMFNKNNQLPYDIIIVDELSMIGGDLFYKLIQSISTGSKLIMLGDIGQLESIGVANVAKDILYSNIIPCIKLTKIHRQAQKSAIITESLKMRKEEQIVERGFTGVDVRGELRDLKLDVYNDKEDTAKKVIEYFTEEINKDNNIMNTLVLVPMKTRGNACTYQLNNKLQNIYNPKSKDKKEVQISYTKELKYILREGDKIINSKNNYKTMDLRGDNVPIFNGNMGIIEEIDNNTGVMIISFEGIGEIIVPKKYYRSIELGYAITVHKSQGSQINTIITGIDFSSYKLLTKELVYTAITRAKHQCILCTQNKALRYATTNSNVLHKQTFLKDMLVSLNKK